jgi:hypothetical protein
MFKACCCVLLAGWGLTAQTAPVTAQAIEKLNSTLRAIGNAGAPSESLSRQLADSMMALALRDRRPARPDVIGFTNEFTRVLIGRKFDDDQAAVLQQCLTDVVRGTGISNFALARRLRETLTALRVDDLKTDLVTRRFLAIAEAVRGPDDSPVHS